MKSKEFDEYDRWYESWTNGDLTFAEIKEGYRKFYGEDCAEMLADEWCEDDGDLTPEENAVFENKWRHTYTPPHREPTEFSRAIENEYRRQRWSRFKQNIIHDAANFLIWGVFITIVVAITICIKGA